jgi:ACR3 family arsenite efflux pump ArsB
MRTRPERPVCTACKVGPLIEIPALIGLVAFWMRRRYFISEMKEFQVHPVEAE